MHVTQGFKRPFGVVSWIHRIDDPSITLGLAPTKASPLIWSDDLHVFSEQAQLGYHFVEAT